MSAVEFVIHFKDEASRTASKIADEFKKAEGNSEKFERSVKGLMDEFSSNSAKQFNNTLKDINHTADQSTRSIGNMSAGVGGLMRNLGVAYGVKEGIQALNNYKNAALDTYGEFEKLDVVLTNTLGSKSESKQAFAMIREFAAETPFQVAELTDSFVKLANRGFVATKSEMTNMGDLAAVTGKSFDQLAEAILDAETNEYERLKEFGIKARTEGDKVTLAFKGQSIEVDKSAEAIRGAMLEFGKMEGVAGAMADISGILVGQTSNLEDSYTNLEYVIGERLAPTQMRLNQIIKTTVDWMSQMVAVDPAESIMAEASMISGLVGDLGDSNTAESERLKILEKIKEIAPDVVDGINAENLSLKDLNENLDEYLGKKHGEALLTTFYQDVTEKATKLEEFKNSVAAIEGKLATKISQASRDLTADEYKEFGGIMKQGKASDLPMSEIYKQQGEYLSGHGIKGVFGNSAFTKGLSQWEGYLADAQSQYDAAKKELTDRRKDLFGEEEKPDKKPTVTTDKGGGDKGRKSLNTTASGGRRNTNIQISLGNMIENVVFEGTPDEKREDFKKTVTETLYQVLFAAQATG